MITSTTDREALLEEAERTSSVQNEAFTSEQDDVEVGTDGCLRTSNLRALWGMFILNTLFAFTQLVAAAVANSLSMFSDSGSMLVDSFAYLVNIVLERRKHQLGPSKTKLWEVYASVTSVGLLVAMTVFAIVDATARLKNDDEDDESTVDGKIVFAFAAGNLVLDVVMCFNYCYQLRHNRHNTLQEEIVRETRDELNMVSAFVHLIADTLRSLTSIIAGVLEDRYEDDAVKIDAIATYIVCGAILLAATFVFYESFLQYREYRYSSRIQTTETETRTVYQRLT